jgi:hypothetical protein
VRQPHARRRYLPPANPPREWRPWAGAIVGMACCILFAAAFVLLWVGQTR